MKSQLTKKYTHASRITPRLKLSLQESIFFSIPMKNFKIFFPLLLKKLEHPTHNPTMQTADTYGHDNWTTEKEAHAHNKGLPKAGVMSFYDSFVLNQTLVFQMNGNAETPRLRQAPKRYA